MSGPPMHCPFRQKLALVHALLSLQVSELLLVCTQPVAGLQPSVVHELPSSQLTAGPGWHVPPPQASGAVQAVASSQGAVLAGGTQPLAGLREVGVRPLPRSP